MRLIRDGLVVLLALLSLCVGPRPAVAERRLAMVVGIDHYVNFGPDAQLRRAVADAEGIAGHIEALGFSVTKLARDKAVTQDVFLRKFAEFTQTVQPGDTVLFYFAGHGVGLEGTNYLVPADIPNMADADQYLFRAHALAESDIRARIQERGAAVTVLMLDACRNNPFRSNDRALGATRGLEPIEASKGVLTIYAAGYGQTALDRLSDQNDPDPNSVFTRVVLRELDKPGINLVDFSEDVREQVATIARSVGHNQVPAVDNQLLGGRSIYLQGHPPQPAGTSPPAPAADEAVWTYVQGSRDPAALRRFATDYPMSRHAPEAQVRIASLEAPTGPTPSARAPREDETVWAGIAQSDFAAEFRDFLQRFPNSPLRFAAQARLKALDEGLWARTGRKDVAGLQHYLALFPDGPHRSEAEIAVARLDTEKPPPIGAPALALRDDETAWTRVATSNFSADIRDFLVRFPGSPLRPEAEARLKVLDEALWAETQPSDITGLRHYMAVFAGGAHQGEAETRLASLEAPRPDTPRPPDPVVVAASPEGQAQPNDQAEWARIGSSTFATDFASFIKAFPKSPLRQQAEARLKALDEALWTTSVAGDPAALRHYLALFPGGSHRGEAERGLRTSSMAEAAPAGHGQRNNVRLPEASAPRLVRPAPIVHERPQTVAAPHPAQPRKAVAKSRESGGGRGCFMSEGERFCP